MKKTIIILTPLILALTGCTGKPSDDLIKSSIWTTESLKSNNLGDFYEAGDFKITDKSEFNQGKEQRLVIEQKMKLTKDCDYSAKSIDGLGPCGQQSEYYEKKNVKAGKDFLVTYKISFAKNSAGDWKSRSKETTKSTLTH